MTPTRVAIATRSRSMVGALIGTWAVTRSANRRETRARGRTAMAGEGGGWSRPRPPVLRLLVTRQIVLAHGGRNHGAQLRGVRRDLLRRAPFRHPDGVGASDATRGLGAPSPAPPSPAAAAPLATCAARQRPEEHAHESHRHQQPRSSGGGPRDPAADVRARARRRLPAPRRRRRRVRGPPRFAEQHRRGTPERRRPLHRSRRRSRSAGAAACPACAPPSPNPTRGFTSG